MKYLFKSIVIFSVLLATSALAGPSAKFAATYTKGIGLGSVAVINDATADASTFDFDAGYTLARIKVPQDKELLVGVSADIGLVTDTSIKGKEGGAAKAIAGAGAGVVVFAVPVGSHGSDAIAEPGFVILNSRVQALSATLGGVIDACSVVDDLGNVECTFTDEEIGLALATMSANHFNFVLPDMDQGEYDLVAFFVTGAGASVNIDEASVSDGGSVSASAYALAFIGKTMVTVQQVRAAKGGIIDADIVEP